jgi:hypothetical protein
MSILERSAMPPPPATETRRSDRLRVITAGDVGNMDARLGTSGFDVVAVAESEDALIDAASAAEPDAIIVEADLCASLEHVRELAPDALLIVVGDHTPAGALGRIERGVSGTVMAGILHALVAEGVGAAVGWGLVPAFGPRGALQVPQRISGWLLSAKADLVREYVANALRDHVELVTAASTVAVTVSASVLLTLTPARSHERPQERPPRVLVATPTAERALQSPVVTVLPTTRSLAHYPSMDLGEPGTRRGQSRGEGRDHGRHVGEIVGLQDQGEIADAQDQGEIVGVQDQGEGDGAQDDSESDGAHGQGNHGDKDKDGDDQVDESDGAHGQGNHGDKDKDGDDQVDESDGAHGQGNHGDEGNGGDDQVDEIDGAHGQGNHGDKGNGGDDQVNSESDGAEGSDGTEASDGTEGTTKAAAAEAPRSTS